MVTPHELPSSACVYVHMCHELLGKCLSFSRLMNFITWAMKECKQFLNLSMFTSYFSSMDEALIPLIIYNDIKHGGQYQDKY
jgi:hypothetical protein